jgi:hypothetical protein
VLRKHGIFTPGATPEQRVCILARRDLDQLDQVAAFGVHASERKSLMQKSSLGVLERLMLKANKNKKLFYWTKKFVMCNSTCNEQQ